MKLFINKKHNILNVYDKTYIQYIMYSFKHLLTQYYYNHNVSYLDFLEKNSETNELFILVDIENDKYIMMYIPYNKTYSIGKINLYNKYDIEWDILNLHIKEYIDFILSTHKSKITYNPHIRRFTT